MKKSNLNYMIGKTFGKLEVIKVGEIKKGKQYVRVQCSCGSPEKEIRACHLKNGSIVSCLCFNSLCVMYKLPRNNIYNVWSKMLERCNDKNKKAYKNYGGRGINVCEEWLSSDNFIHWVGKSNYKEGLTLDRIDNNKGYSPNNCRWSSRKEQSINKRNTIKITHNGKTMPVLLWAEKLNISYETLRHRLYNGNTGDDLFRKDIGIRENRRVERQQNLLDLLKTHKVIKTKEICDILNVCEKTIRNDIKYLKIRNSQIITKLGCGFVWTGEKNDK